MIVGERQGVSGWLRRDHSTFDPLDQVVEEASGNQVLIDLVNIKHSCRDLIVVLLGACLLGQLLILLLGVLVSLEWHSVVVGPSHVVAKLNSCDALLLHLGVDVIIFAFESLVEVSRDSSNFAGNLIFVQLTVGFSCRQNQIRLDARLLNREGLEAVGES